MMHLIVVLTIFQDIWQALSDVYHAIVDGFGSLISIIANPVFLLAKLFAWAGTAIASLLPDAIDLSVLSRYEEAVLMFSEGYRIANYFVNMHVLMLCLSIMAAIEAGMLLLRGWRMIRSLIT